MSRIDATESSRPSQRRSGRDAEAFRIHWGRTVLAVIGLLAIIGGVGTAVVAPFAAGLSWSVPALFAAVFAASLVSLQVTAAVRRRARRRERVERAMRDAMDHQPLTVRTPPATAASVSRRGEHELHSDAASAQGSGPFNALTSDQAGKGGPDSLVALDADGLPDNADRLFGEHSAAASATNHETEAVHVKPSSAETWDVRAVPAAHYMVAAKAERPEPEPLEKQEPVPSSGVKLKQSAASPEKPELATGAQESINLDQVLQRRRA